MFCFLFRSFLIKCVFLSHNVIWKQFLPTAGFAFTIGKHGKGKAGKMRSVTREPPPHPLGSPSEAYLGSLHKPQQSRDVFKQAAHTAVPPPEGQHALGGECSGCFADKTDQMQTRLPAATLSGPPVQANPVPTARVQARLLRVPGEPLREQSRPRVAATKANKETRARRALAGSPTKTTVPLTSASGSFHTDPAKRPAHSCPWVLAPTLSTLFTNTLSSGPEAQGRLQLEPVQGDKAQAAGAPRSHVENAVLLVQVSNLGETGS